MSNKPTTGEWTPENISEKSSTEPLPRTTSFDRFVQEICAAHNAALIDEFVPDPDSFVPEADQRELHTTTGEWTAERITRIAENNPTLWAETVARELNRLNAALAAANRKGEDLTVSGMTAVGSLMATQKTLVDALKKAQRKLWEEWPELASEIDAVIYPALAKVDK